MNNTMMKARKFLSNKNTVTILCAIIGIAVLYVGYTLRVQSAIEPITVPYAKETIQPRTKITSDMIGTMEVASAAYEKMKGDVLLSTDDIIGHYTGLNTVIPAGSMFYSSSVVDSKEENDLDEKTPEGYVLTSLSVNLTTTTVNSIVPDTYVDFYIQTKDSTTQIVRVGKFIKNIKILAVRDSSGNDVFEDSEEDRTPAYLIFALPADLYAYYTMVTTLNITITPVPTHAGEDGEEVGEPEITSDELIEYISQLASEFSQTVVNLDDDEENNDGTDNNGE